MPRAHAWKLGFCEQPGTGPSQEPAYGDLLVLPRVGPARHDVTEPARTHAWGSGGGRWFKSSHPDHIL